jgi:Na+/melibiose symporter-like transporter
MLFAAPGFVGAMMHGPGGGILAGVYAKYFGVSLAALGTAMLVGRLFDAFTDPMIGYLSDRTKSPIGKRKPWIIAGYALSLIAFYYLYIPGDGVGVGYFTFWYIALFFAWTLAEIPYLAWQADISHDYDERARVVTFRLFADRSGRLLFAALPLIPLFATSEFTPEFLEFLAWGIIVVLPFTVAGAVIFAPQGRTVAVRDTKPIWDFAKTLPSNKPAMLIIGAQLASGLGDGFFSALIFLYFDVFLQEGDKLAYMLILMSSVSLLSMPMWLKVMGRLGKHQTWRLGNILAAMLAVVFLFIDPGEYSVYFALALVTLIMFVYTAGGVAAPAVLADVVDYDMLKTGANRGGQFYSLFTLIFKLNYAFAAAVALWTLDLFDFDATAASQTLSGTIGMKIGFGAMPALFIGISVWFLFKFPLNKRRCEIITRRLEQRADRAGLTEEN